MRVWVFVCVRAHVCAWSFVSALLPFVVQIKLGFPFGFWKEAETSRKRLEFWSMLWQRTGSKIRWFFWWHPRTNSRTLPFVSSITPICFWNTSVLLVYQRRLSINLQVHMLWIGWLVKSELTLGLITITLIDTCVFHLFAMYAKVKSEYSCSRVRLWHRRRVPWVFFHCNAFKSQLSQVT